MCSIFRNWSEPIIGLSIPRYCNMAVQHCRLYGRVPTPFVHITGLLSYEKQFLAIHRHLKQDKTWVYLSIISNSLKVVTCKNYAVKCLKNIQTFLICFVELCSCIVPNVLTMFKIREIHISDLCSDAVRLINGSEDKSSDKMKLLQPKRPEC